MYSYDRSCTILIDHLRSFPSLLCTILTLYHPCFASSLLCTILACTILVLYHPCFTPTMLCIILAVQHHPCFAPSLCSTILALYQPCFAVALLRTILASTGLRELRNVVFVCYAIAPCIMMLSIYGGSARNRPTDQQTSRPANQQTST